MRRSTSAVILYAGAAPHSRNSRASAGSTVSVSCCAGRRSALYLPDPDLAPALGVHQLAGEQVAGPPGIAHLAGELQAAAALLVRLVSRKLGHVDGLGAFMIRERDRQRIGGNDMRQVGGGGRSRARAAGALACLPPWPAPPPPAAPPAP